MPKRAIYFLIFLFLLGVEIAIATYLKTGFIRAYLGDLLVVILLYCLLMSTLKPSVKTGLILTLAIAFAIELLQLVNLTKFFPQEYKQLATLVLGSHFSWLDLLMYVLGIVVAGITELVLHKRYSLPST
ncbi:MULTISPECIES: ribosomal maturation YjgA family protein [Leeuwenhoekiella]|jgi:hypothetical protein|uniref:ribosomal maturation YjgA family protein n=1 Tax=Leeuwenhoekiella TaxID=283735 RepID=UPI000C51A43C|nr:MULTISPECIES: DUF2809 domain-containing protein [Leeuwenhoekiella]MAO42309.1 hypothetical protein [Leeuwenhoekiella sp.]HBT09796.1 DUF2809 domain-containing protein [Leeuwenhoekiella sp.]HCW64142.1 DUF2809 domain-containing protein [Leeuwenhoekiella sp.]|tara:strand:+ start:4971 stop:5357 length:387 start_codon:yes stop_codon:yes gene_type:complete